MFISMLNVWTQCRGGGHTRLVASGDRGRHRAPLCSAQSRWAAPLLARTCGPSQRGGHRQQPRHRQGHRPRIPQVSPSSPSSMTLKMKQEFWAAAGWSAFGKASSRARQSMSVVNSEQNRACQWALPVLEQAHNAAQTATWPHSLASVGAGQDLHMHAISRATFIVSHQTATADSCNSHAYAKFVADGAE